MPPGLALKVDNRDNWPSYNFPWGVGETHRLEAPAQLTDSQGRLWSFAAGRTAATACRIYVPDRRRAWECTWSRPIIRSARDRS